jgi:hypothetical protein
MSTRAHLVALIRERSFGEVTPGVRALTDELLARYGRAVQAVLYYGACMRKGDDRDGLVDLYVLVDSYRSAYGRGARALLNKLLPPNVFYLEVLLDGRLVRAKYAVLSLADFQRGTSTRWFHSYLWGRFAQPTGLVYAADDQVAREVLAALAQAVVTFAGRALPQMAPQFEAEDLWQKGLQLSYRAELRAERPGRIRGLFDASPDHYERLTRAAVALVPFSVEVDPGAGVDDGAGRSRWRARISPWLRYRNRVAWRIRSVQGKALSVLRLAKASLTFRGGVDYILWKIERHSGVALEARQSLGRRPLLAVWKLAWQLYRRGAFR